MSRRRNKIKPTKFECNRRSINKQRGTGGTAIADALSEIRGLDPRDQAIALLTVTSLYFASSGSKRLIHKLSCNFKLRLGAVSGPGCVLYSFLWRICSCQAMYVHKLSLAHLQNPIKKDLVPLKLLWIRMLNPVVFGTYARVT